MVLLFYRYVRLAGGLAEQKALVEAQRRLGEELQLRGRVLLALEGINGTVQGSSSACAAYQEAVQTQFGSGIDWKRSEAGDEPLFPDFAVKEVAELVGLGIQSDSPLDVQEETAKHLSPADFHRLVADTPAEEIRLVDVRNRFEYEVGHFEGAIDPGMAHTGQWSRFVNQNLEDLRGRRVLLYCTGGIRCEKASAYLCRRLREAAAKEPQEDFSGDALLDPAGTVYQLEGGIHRYLEAYPDGGHFRGANFVFDRRAQMRPGTLGETVGRCSECDCAWDTHHGGRVCCVCRALVLVCDTCDAASAHGEYWCADHVEYRGVYFHFVDRFEDPAELDRQAQALRSLLAAQAVGQKGKNRRASLRKKALEVETHATALRRRGKTSQPDRGPPPRRCRACERPYADCPGSCWGFWRTPEGGSAA